MDVFKVYDKEDLRELSRVRHLQNNSLVDTAAVRWNTATDRDPLDVIFIPDNVVPGPCHPCGGFKIKFLVT